MESDDPPTDLSKYLGGQIQKYTRQEILSATNNFSDENLITESALGKVYKGELLRGEILTVRRLDCKYGQGDEMETEISTLKNLENKNIISIFGFCDEDDEKVIIYEQAFHGTLEKHLRDVTLTWSQRLNICLGVARALHYIHYDIIHCDINSSKIFLDKDWEPKIYGFELSTKYPQSWKHRLLYSHYLGPDNITPKYDIYSFGVLLVEVLCGSKPLDTDDGIPEELIDTNLRKQMDAESLGQFQDLVYKCLNQQPEKRPTMDQVIKELEEVLELQVKQTNLEYSEIADEDSASNSVKMDLLKIPLREIRKATNNFDNEYYVGSGGYAMVYKAKLDVLDVESLSSMEAKSRDEMPKITKTVAIKRIFIREDGQGKEGFLTEINLLTSCKHPNIVRLLGFCSEALEMILVYEYAFNGSLGVYFENNDKSVNLSWTQRVQICLDIAHGINYLHTKMDKKPVIIHRDIKSDNILLDENLNAKLADFGLSKFHGMQSASTVHTKNIAGTRVYMDPEYSSEFKYNRKSDIYSFGVVLFEVLSGSMAYDAVYVAENDTGLAHVARRRYSEGTLKELIDPKFVKEDNDYIFTLNKGPNQDSFHTFTEIAHHCLAETQARRPTMEVVIRELKTALNLQGETMVLSKFCLRDIEVATDKFSETYRIGLDANSMVYKAELDLFGKYGLLAAEGNNNGVPSKKSVAVAIKRITSKKSIQEKKEFFAELEMSTSTKHPNIVSVIGFCDEFDEMILVYDYDHERSLDKYLKSLDNLDNFTWTRRQQLCLEIARGLNDLHTMMNNQQRMIQTDITSANIMLDKNLEAKIAYFKITKNQEINIKVYEDPEYKTTGKLKSDIYSFGVVIFEIICGRLAYDPVYIEENVKGLGPIARECYIHETIERIMHPKVKDEINEDSLYIYSDIAYKCLKEGTKRPNMENVIRALKALKAPLLHGSLVIWVDDAQNLQNMDVFHKTGEEVQNSEITSDLYVSIALNDAVIGRTYVIGNRENPVWTQYFCVPVAHRTTKLDFYLKGGDVVIGTVSIPVEQIYSGARIEGLFPIVGINGKQCKAGALLRLRIQYYPLENVRLYSKGVGLGPGFVGVPNTYFPLRRGGRVTLYQDAHVHNRSLPDFKLDQGRNYEHGSCWNDIYDAISNARHLIYVTGWAVWHKMKLVRGVKNEISLGELLRLKSKEGVRVLLLVWDDPSSRSILGSKLDWQMDTHVEETRSFFKNSSVKVILAPHIVGKRHGWVYQQEVVIFSHHQKTVIVDTDAGYGKRRIQAFIGGLDLCKGRYDTPQHPLFRSSQTVHADDFHNPNFSGNLAGVPREPWHDMHCKIDGPAAYDVLTTFQEQWLKASKPDDPNGLKSSYDNSLLNLERLPQLLGSNDQPYNDDQDPKGWYVQPFNNDQDPEGWHVQPYNDDQDPEGWHVQIFRSIDSNSVIGFPTDPKEATIMNLVCGNNVMIDMSIHTAYVKAIRSAQHYIYIENQCFIGSSYNWSSHSDLGADNLIPMEIALKVASKIRAGERFAAYILIPMWPESAPTGFTTQRILCWQKKTMQMMYEMISEALAEVGLHGVFSPQDYLNFFCLGNREAIDPHDNVGDESTSSGNSPQGLAGKNRRFMIYVHSKGMIVDDEFVIIGSANVNQRSMDGAGDTEIAMGAYQPHHTWAKKLSYPRGQVYGYRISLWAEHLGLVDDRFSQPESIECVRHVRSLSEANWRQFAADEVSEMRGHLLKYPVEVDPWGKVKSLPGCENFPDVGGKIVGSLTAIPEDLIQEDMTI